MRLPAIQRAPIYKKRSIFGYYRQLYYKYGFLLCRIVILHYSAYYVTIRAIKVNKKAATACNSYSLERIYFLVRRSPKPLVLYQIKCGYVNDYSAYLRLVMYFS